MYLILSRTICEKLNEYFILLEVMGTLFTPDTGSPSEKKQIKKAIAHLEKFKLPEKLIPKKKFQKKSFHYEMTWLIPSQEFAWLGLLDISTSALFPSEVVEKKFLVLTDRVPQMDLSNFEGEASVDYQVFYEQ